KNAFTQAPISYWRPCRRQILPLQHALEFSLQALGVRHFGTVEGSGSLHGDLKQRGYYLTHRHLSEKGVPVYRFDEESVGLVLHVLGNRYPYGRG
ncbi:hypothetical protein, partial [Pseudomonas sp. BDPW]